MSARAIARSCAGWPSGALRLFLLLLGAGFWHLALGLQVVIEDYVHREGLKIALILLAKFACIALALAGILSLFTIAFGG